MLEERSQAEQHIDAGAGAIPSDAAADAAPSPHYPAYEAARPLIPVGAALIPVVADLTAHYTIYLDTKLHDATMVLAPLAADLPEGAPLAEIYAELLEMSHIARTIGERSAQIDRPAALDPRTATQLMQEFAGLILLAMDMDDRMAGSPALDG